MGIKRSVALLLSAVLVCALCVTALPKTAHAAYGLDLTTGVDQSGTNWRWADASRTLTLSGLNYTTTEPVAIRLPANATIYLTPGTANTVTSAGGSNCYGILCEDAGGVLTITGGGSLTVTGGAANQYGSKGVHVLCGLTVSGGSKVTGVGGNASEYSHGIFARSLTVEDASEVEGRSGGAATAETNIGVSIIGTVTVSDSAKLTGVAGAATVRSCGISCNAGVVTGGTILASSGASPNTGALSGQPNLGGYPSYNWRTAATAPFTLNIVQPYVWDASHTYVEIRPGSGGGGGGVETGADVPRTGDTARPWLWASLALLAGAGLAVSAVLKKKRTARSSAAKRTEKADKPTDGMEDRGAPGM